MNATFSLSEAISELFAQVSYTGKLTSNDRHYLMQALLEETTSDEEKQAIDRLLYAIRAGRVRVLKDDQIF